jgi:BirA family biotin operon repressor/biotin-[acetyl-CoA-carboxylase] ligase
MKHDTLAFLQQNPGNFISGADISRTLGVTRSAVWKDIKALRQDGYTIEAVTNRGYRLTVGPSLLGSEAQRLLTTERVGRCFTLTESVDSTNRQALRAVETGAPDGAVFAAWEQTAGRGRMGRSWYSAPQCPPGSSALTSENCPRGSSSLMMSILLRPRTSVANAAQITLVAGLAVFQGIEDVLADPAHSDEASRSVLAIPKTGVKWPNDILINGKKTAGILTELMAEIELIKAIAVGIGINVQLTSFPPELAGSATSLMLETGKSVSVNALAAAILNRFEPLYNMFLEDRFASDILPQYRQHCVTLGQDVRTIHNNQEIRGRAVSVNSAGELLVQLSTGGRVALNSSEVSIRGFMNCGP